MNPALQTFLELLRAGVPKRDRNNDSMQFWLNGHRLRLNSLEAIPQGSPYWSGLKRPPILQVEILDRNALEDALRSADVHRDIAIAMQMIHTLRFMARDEGWAMEVRAAISFYKETNPIEGITVVQAEFKCIGAPEYV